MRCVLMLIPISALILPATGVLAGPAEDAFNDRYGQELRIARATREYADDLALIEKLVASARIEPDADVKLIMLDQAYLLGLRSPEGYGGAIDAMELMAEAAPERRADALGKAADVCQRRYKASRGAAWNEAGDSLVATLVKLGDAQRDADDLRLARGSYTRAAATAKECRSGRLAEAEARIEKLAVYDRLAELKRIIEARPEDRKAREELLTIYLVEMDNPEKASAFVDRESQAELDRYILVAAMKVETIPEAGCAKLGDWYRGLAAKASDAGKPAMLRRAKAYYDRFLQLHKADDVERSRVAVGAGEVGMDLEALSKIQEVEAEWADLAKLVDLRRHVVNGKWAPRGNGFVASPGPYGYLVIPAAPEGSYELEVKYHRALGTGKGLFIALPAGPGACMLRLGGGKSDGYWYGASVYGDYSGLELINGADFASNDTTKYESPANGADHTVLVHVDVKAPDVTITVTVDGKQFIKWAGGIASLGWPKLGRDVVPRAFGIGADGSNVWFQSIRVKVLTGRLRTS